MGSMSRSAAVIMALAAMTVASGCTSERADNTGENEQQSQPLGPARATQSIDEAADDLTAAIESGDCDRINDFNPISRQEALSTKERCKALEARLTGAKLVGTEEYEGSGVIDFQRGAQTITALMVVDQDGKFHLVTLDGLLGEPSAETQFARQFDAAAEDAFEALTTKDCDAFLDLASRQIGPASITRDRKDVCAFVDNNRIATLAGADSKLSPKRLGGNADYAFYGIGTPSIFLTMTMARQSGAELPEGVSKPPPDAAEYAFLDVLPTNARTAAGSGSG